MISGAIRSFIKGPKSKVIINSRSCPGSRLATDTCNEQCGLELIDRILRWTIPSLGVKVDVTSVVEVLQILPSKTLSSFMINYNAYNKSARDAGIQLIPNTIIWNMMGILAEYHQVVPYITDIVRECNRWIYSTPNTELIFSSDLHALKSETRWHWHDHPPVKNNWNQAHH